MQGKKPKEIARMVNEKYGTHLSSTQVRDRARYYPEYHEYNARQEAVRKQNRGKGSPPPESDLLRVLLKNTKPLSDLAGGFNVSVRVLVAQIEDLKDQGYLFEEINGAIRLRTTLIPEENVHIEEWSGDRVIRFGAIGDTHLCNKWQQVSHLNTMYDIFGQEGITSVYHAGDLSDGYYKGRPGHVYELFAIGADEQSDYIIEKYPQRPGITTSFILGNHDAQHIVNGGANIGLRIAAARPDMRYLGMDNARVMLTPNCSLEINHPGDGSAYALSYSLQKLIDSMSGGEKPKILLNGHHHKAMYLPIYRNIHSLEVGTFEAQTPFMRAHKLAAHVGGWICEAKVDEMGTVYRFSAEFIAFHIPIKDDY